MRYPFIPTALFSLRQWDGGRTVGVLETASAAVPTASGNRCVSGRFCLGFGDESSCALGRLAPFPSLLAPSNLAVFWWSAHGILSGILSSEPSFPPRSLLLDPLPVFWPSPLGGKKEEGKKERKKTPPPFRPASATNDG